MNTSKTFWTALFLILGMLLTAPLSAGLFDKIKEKTKTVVQKAKELTDTDGPDFPRDPGARKPSLNPNDRGRYPNEEAWYNALPQINLADLKEGDILFKKDYTGKHFVTIGQSGFRAKMGSKHSVHFMIYLGKGEVAESVREPVIGGREGVQILPLDGYRGKQLMVYRLTSGNPKPAIAGALKVARSWAVTKTQTPKIKYSESHILGTALGSSSFGPEAEKRAAMVRRLTPPEKAMMCSEFVTYCYQYLNPPALRLDGKYTAPIRLEDYLNQTGNFEFAGRLTP